MKNSNITFDKSYDDLFLYAIDRNDIKLLLNSLPKSFDDKRNVLEYELQLLRILSVGWAIAFFMFKKSSKKFVLEGFWEEIQKFSVQISSTASLASGGNIDYFDILKKRMHRYVTLLSHSSTSVEAITVIGPLFAKLCDLEGETYAILLSTKLFNLTITAVKEYLDSI